VVKLKRELFRDLSEYDNNPDALNEQIPKLVDDYCDRIAKMDLTRAELAYLFYHWREHQPEDYADWLFP